LDAILGHAGSRSGDHPSTGTLTDAVGEDLVRPKGGSHLDDGHDEEEQQGKNQDHLRDRLAAL
jgi:hypothetical protein